MNYEQMGKNLKDLVDATEWFTTLMYFLYEQRNIQNLTLLIGNFTYEDLEADIHCIMKTNASNCNIYFTETRYDMSNNPKLIEEIELINLCFGWSFDEAEINFDFNIIENYRNMLDQHDNEIFSGMYHEIHSDFW